MAIERYRRNYISSLKLDDGTVTTDHEKIVGCFWSTYKARVGQSQGITLAFDLQSLLHKVDGLDDVTLPFSKEEMDRTVK